MNAEPVQSNEHLSLPAADAQFVATENTALIKDQTKGANTTLYVSSGIFLVIFGLATSILGIRSEPEPFSTWWGYPIYLLGAICVVSGMILIVIYLDRTMKKLR